MICINEKPLEENSVGPPLVLGDPYFVKEVYKCECGQEHYDVGLKSIYNWISCYKCKKAIPRGTEIHWCHPSRFTE